MIKKKSHQIIKHSPIYIPNKEVMYISSAICTGLNFEPRSLIGKFLQIDPFVG